MADTVKVIVYRYALNGLSGKGMPNGALEFDHDPSKPLDFHVTGSSPRFRVVTDWQHCIETYPSGLVRLHPL